ncbi:YeeE/YedE thiosulfate transporter family protein [Bacillus massiliigorillae]|uniref:YeeE/YedE thiosulfate transporter family protein n=1 Tax=Bacillus massiliigorillae TaxID=1243664 RepID=UPI0003A2D4EF|nr:YeeE/YedE thiosulfate transporter family protein [Bacillus massiliigorillae]
MDLILGLLIGGLFGFTLHFIGAANPKNILGMLSLKNLQLMKTILFGIGLSSVLLFLSTKLGIIPEAHLDIKTAHIGVIVGGLIFGLSFGLAGFCPGTSISAAGSGRKDAWVYLVGGLLGALTLALSFSFFKNLGWFEPLFNGKSTLFTIVSDTEPLFTLSTSGGVILGMLFIGIAWILPEKV